MLMRRLRTFTPLGSLNGVSLKALLAICNGVGVGSWWLSSNRLASGLARGWVSESYSRGE